MKNVISHMLVSQRDAARGTSPGSPEGQKGKRFIPDLGEEVADADGFCVTIPKGCIGELRCAFKAGCDFMWVIYGRADSAEVHGIGNCDAGTQTGDQANRRFTPGVWNLWVYNKTKGRFETIMKKSVHLQGGNDSYILGATHRISATHKTCIVCVVDVVQEDKKSRSRYKNYDDETDVRVPAWERNSVASNLHRGSRDRGSS